MKVSLISTVFNESESINSFLESIDSQSVLPDEVIITDGGSTDDTVKKILSFNPRRLKSKVILINLRGNRSVGRNEAIKRSTHEIITCSDTGCTLGKDWIKNITKPFSSEGVDVVAGYYEGKFSNIFQKCLIPYVLVMEDKINSEDFLPATRSVAFRKELWEKVGRFDESLSNNEDYAFAKKLKKINVNIVFVKKAIVYWKPRKNFYEAFVMFYRFAMGDIESGIVRPKVILVFLRYLVGIVLLFLYLISENQTIILLIIFFLIFYVILSILKNYKYVKDIKAFLYLPLLQFTADFAVLLGTTIGFLKSFFIKK